MEDKPQLSEAKRKLLEQMRRANASSPSSQVSDYGPQARDNPIPMAPAQEQVWRLDQSFGKPTSLHNESITIHRHGSCDHAILERCFHEIVRRHEIWRTSYKQGDGKPIQIVHSNLDFRLGFSDLRTLHEGERETRALELATEDARMPFDLTTGPLFRARLVTLNDDEHKLYVTAHQSIVDGITVFDIFPRELTTLYDSFTAGASTTLAELPAQFAEFASWERRKLEGATRETQLSYWQKQLAGDVPALRWPNGGNRPERPTYRGAMYPFEFPRELASSLGEIAQREGATLFMALLGAFYVLLHRYTGQHYIIVGTLSPCGRKHSAFQQCMGYFLNPVPLRANLSGTSSFRPLLQQMREVTLGAISNDDVTLEMIAERLQVSRDLSRHYFFDVALSLAPDVAPLPPGWSMTYMDVESGGARFDLYIEFSDRPDALLGRAQYNPDLFTPERMSRTIEDFRRLLEEIVACPDSRILGD